MRNLVIFFIVLSIGFYACKKDQYLINNNAILEFSTDTVQFDTIFATIGSVTRQLKVYNRHNKDVEINSIDLLGGRDSYFRLNIDGIPGNNAENVEIAANDSMFIFVEITADTSGQDLPIIVHDSIIFTIDGNSQFVNLIAWGQDAHLFRGETIDSEVWTNDKPYLIYDSLVVAESATLSIEEGVVVYFHKDAYMRVRGLINVNGVVTNPVLFCGDRLEELYDDIPGQWKGIYLGGEGEHIFNHVTIKNAVNGIWAGDVTSLIKTKLRLTNVVIKNMTSIGIYSENAGIFMGNCLVTNCYYHAVSLIGGYLDCFHSTIANYPDFFGLSSSSLILSNYYIDSQNQLQKVGLEKAYFGNSIIYGSRINEIEFNNTYEEELVDEEYDYEFEYCLLRIDESLNTSDTSYFKNIIKNESPEFFSVDELNFRLDSVSAAFDNGSVDIMNMHSFLLDDIVGTSRIVFSPPDIGAYERSK